jgi:hypothetical protein
MVFLILITFFSGAEEERCQTSAPVLSLIIEEVRVFVCRSGGHIFELSVVLPSGVFPHPPGAFLFLYPYSTNLLLIYDSFVAQFRGRKATGTGGGD